MGMSIDQGSNVDLQAILAGGADFMDRLERFNSAKQAADAAVANLNLGKAALEARDEASRQLDAAKEEAAAIKQQAVANATAAQKQLNDFVAATMAEQNRAMQSAQAKEAEADQKLLAANERLAAADKAKADAVALLTKASEAQAAVEAARTALSAL
jgi:hypothetical protein